LNKSSTTNTIQTVKTKIDVKTILIAKTRMQILSEIPVFFRVLLEVAESKKLELASGSGSTHLS